MDQLLEQEKPKRIAELFQDLNPQAQTILILRYGLNSQPQTFKEIGSQIGLSREGVRLQEKKALSKLRET